MTVVVVVGSVVVVVVVVVDGGMSRSPLVPIGRWNMTPEFRSTTLSVVSPAGNGSTTATLFGL